MWDKGILFSIFENGVTEDEKGSLRWRMVFGKIFREGVVDYYL